MTKRILILVLSLFPQFIFANDYPTQARVEYVLLCMKAAGGQTIVNLYSCSCAVDKLSEKLSYDQLVEAETLASMIKTPGEKGGAFRDIPNAREFLKSINKMKESAFNSCVVKTPSTAKSG